MSKIGHAYKAWVSYIHYFLNVIKYRILKISYFLFRIIYIPLTIIHKLSFFAGLIFPFIWISILLKEYYPSHYTLSMCVEAHMEAGVITGGLIIKYLVAGAFLGLLLFIAFFLVTRTVAKIGQWISSGILNSEKNISSYRKSSMEHSYFVTHKHLSEEEQMEIFKRGNNYIPPHEMFGYKETATTYYEKIKYNSSLESAT